MASTRIVIILVLAIYSKWPLAETACDVCQNNGAACVNLTSFHLCFGDNKPHTDQLFTCKDGLEDGFQSSTRPASCGDRSSCGMCNDNQVFACTSRTTFLFCFGAITPSDQGGSCPLGKVCDASTQSFCVDEVHANSIICDLDAPPNVY